MRAAVVLAVYAATVVVASWVQQTWWLAAGAALVLLSAGRRAPSLARRTVRAVAPFALAVSLGWVVVARGDGARLGAVLLRLNLRVLLLTSLALRVLPGLDWHRALAFSPTLRFVLVLATSQVLTFRRLFRDFGLALAARAPGRPGLLTSLRHGAATGAWFVRRAEHDAADITHGLTARGSSLIAIEHVSHAFGAEPALRDVSARVAAGEKVVLLGCNGCGKSTLLRVAAGLLAPAAGRVVYDGRPVAAGLADKAFRRRFRREVGLLFQNPDAMLFNATVLDEIAFGPRQHGLASPEDHAREWARRVGVDGVLARAPWTLSAGQKQLVCLASLLVLEPRLLLLDEPTSALDPRSTGWLVDFLQDLPQTLVVATHNLSLATELGRRGLVLGEDHALLHDGDLLDLRDDHDVLRRANLVHIHDHRHRDGDTTHRHYHSHDWD